ncbi:MAG TPA: prepilin-type N-terminal cleavage/methylation domain-containing protein, partial [Verrucomicrobiae bacterium]|nr:prepilin-type N-terminal cleavage/methylation domain-containing protein [Verrucomicrobiae bacterium]
MRIKLHRGHCAGFTLLELIISSALMSVVLISAYLCLSAGFSTKKLVEPRLETLQNARVALALITADLRCACVLTQEFEFLGEQRKAGSIQADNLDFATHNYTPGKPREGDYCQVSYFLDKNMETGQFSLWRRRNPRIAPDALAGGRREEIARNVRGLQFE